MDLERLERHVKEHPADYQSVISLFKQRSKAIEKDIEKRRIAKQKLIAEMKERENGEQTPEQSS